MGPYPLSSYTQHPKHQPTRVQSKTREEPNYPDALFENMFRERAIARLTKTKAAMKNVFQLETVGLETHDKHTFNGKCNPAQPLLSKPSSRNKRKIPRTIVHSFHEPSFANPQAQVPKVSLSPHPSTLDP